MHKSHLLINCIDLGTAAIIAGGVSAAGNIASTLFTNSSNSSNVSNTNQQSIDLWREQAAYNTPKNQIARLKAAGLNPNLAYGNLSSANASQAPSLLAHQNVAPQVDPLLAAQIANINADTELKDAQASNTEQSTEESKSRVRIANEEFELGKGLTLANIDNVKSNTSLINKQIDLFDAQTKETLAKVRNLDADSALKDLQRRFESSTLTYRVHEAAVRYHLDEATLKNMYIQIAYSPQLFASTIANLKADSYQKITQGDLNKELKDIYVDENMVRLLTFNDRVNEIKSDSLLSQFNSKSAQLSYTIAEERHNRWSWGMNGFNPFLYINDIIGSAGQLIGGTATYNVGGQSAARGLSGGAKLLK